MDAFEAMSVPQASAFSTHKRFSIDEANRSLVLVRRIVADIVREYARLKELYRECQQVDGESEPSRAQELRHRYVASTDRFSSLRDELEEVGCELKNFSIGLVGFPARIGDGHAWLCWKLGDDQVSQPHEIDADFMGRQPIRNDWV